MKSRILALAAATATAAALAACTADRGTFDSDGAPDAGVSAAANVRSADGVTMAQATATQVGNDIRVRVEAMGMNPGTYGAHVHAVGSCTPPDFTSAGPHWNPTGRQHGKNNPQGMHHGDLPNLSVGTDGRGSFEVTISGARIGGGAARLLDADGAAVVIHAGADDYRTDPTGNSGGRIACGVLG